MYHSIIDVHLRQVTKLGPFCLIQAALKVGYIPLNHVDFDDHKCGRSSTTVPLDLV